MRITQHINKVSALIHEHGHHLGAFAYLSGMRVVQIALGLVTTYFLTRSLSIEQYGEYQFVLNVIGALSVFSLTEFNNTLMQSIARGFKGSYQRMLPYPLIGSMIGSAILLMAAMYQTFIDPHPHLAIAFLIAALFTPFTQGLILWRGLKVGEGNFASFTKLETVGMLASQMGIIGICLMNPGDYVYVLFVFLLFPALFNLGMHLVSAARINKNHSKQSEDGVVSHGLWSSFYSSSFTLSNYIDKLLIYFFIAPSALALFVAADRVADLLRSAVQDMATVLAPKFAKSTTYSYQMDRVIKLFCVGFAVLLGIFAFTLLPVVITTIYGDGYRDAVPYAQAMIVSIALGNLASIQFRYIRSKLDTRNYRNIIVSTSLARIILSVVLIPLFGVAGAVISAILYRLILSTVTDVTIKKYYLGKHEN